MLTPDRLEPFENALRNIACLLMAGMIETMGGLMGDLGQAMSDAFSGGTGTRDVSAEIRKSMSEEQVKLFQEIQGEMQMDPAIRERILRKVDNDAADELLGIVRGVDVGLPPLTDPLPPEALLGYLHLLQQGNEEIGNAVGRFSQRMEELTQSQTAHELEEEYAQRLGSISGSPVEVEIDRATLGEGRDAAPALDQVNSAFQWLSLGGGAKQRRLAEVTRVRVRGVSSADQKGFDLSNGTLDVAVAPSDVDYGMLDGQEMSSAIEERWTSEAAAKAREARRARAVAGPDGLSLEVSGVRVIAPSDPEEDSSLRPFSDDAGTTIALTVRSGGGLVGFRSEESSLRAADDRGTDLTSSDDPSRTEAGFGSFPTLSPDGRACALELRLPGLPAAGATKLELELTLAFEMATGTREDEAKVRFTEGASFTTGGLRFTVTGIESDDWGTRVNVTSNQSLADVFGFRFRSSDGVELECSIASSSTYGGGDEIVEERTLSFSESVDGGTLTVLSYTGRKVVSWPVRVSLGLGL